MRRYCISTRCTNPCSPSPRRVIFVRSTLSDALGMTVAALALLLALVPPAAAQPLRPALKQAQCPVGSMQSGGYCTPLLRNAPPSTEKRGLAPRSPLIPRKAFRLTPFGDAPWRYPGPAPFGRCTQVTALRDTARWCLTLGIAGPTLRRDTPDSAIARRGRA